MVTCRHIDKIFTSCSKMNLSHISIQQTLLIFHPIHSLLKCQVAFEKEASNRIFECMTSSRPLNESSYSKSKMYTCYLTQASVHDSCLV